MTLLSKNSLVAAISFKSNTVALSQFSGNLYSTERRSLAVSVSLRFPNPEPRWQFEIKAHVPNLNRLPRCLLQALIMSFSLVSVVALPRWTLITDCPRGG